MDNGKERQQFAQQPDRERCDKPSPGEWHQLLTVVTPKLPPFATPHHRVGGIQSGLPRRQQ